MARVGGTVQLLARGCWWRGVVRGDCSRWSGVRDKQGVMNGVVVFGGLARGSV